VDFYRGLGCALAIDDAAAGLDEGGAVSFIITPPCLFRMENHEWNPRRRVNNHDPTARRRRSSRPSTTRPRSPRWGLVAWMVVSDT
jgi:hypothetical protein